MAEIAWAKTSWGKLFQATSGVAMFIVGTPTAIGVATFETIRGKNFFDTAGSVYEDFGQVANAIGKFGDSQSETLTRVVLGGVVSAVTGQAIDNIGDHIDHNGPHKT